MTAAVHRLDRFVARVTSENALSFLHDTTTQDLTLLEEGRSAQTCYLDDKGRILAEMRVVVTPDGVLMDAEEAAREAIVERLARIAPLSGVAIEPLGSSVTAVKGTPDGVTIPTWYGADVFGDVDGPAWDTYEADRVAAGEVRFGTDVTAGMLINETPYAARALSHTKGCYPGQESVARVHNLGSIRRRFVALHLDGEPPDAPADLSVDGETVGTLTSVAGDAAIAVVKATVDEGDVMDAGGARATLVRVL